MTKRSSGLSLVELLVSLAIGSILMIGAVYVYQQSRTTHTVSDTVARLQENARYALSILEPDLQLAGYYGFSNSPDDLKFITGGSTAAQTAAPSMMTSAAKVAALDDKFHACGNNFAIDVLATVEGSNGAYELACAAAGGGAQADTDTLTIRRASSVPLAGATNDRLQLLVSRLSPTYQFVLADGSLPANPALDADMVEVRDLIVRTYYVSVDSDGAPGLPALRVKSIGTGGFSDEELMSGVEDLQVQFGIDTGDYDGDGAIDPGFDEPPADGIPDAPNGVATRYVDPDAVPVGFQVVSVRLWLLVRTDQVEQGFSDNRTYSYADKNVTPNDGFRRVLVSRTIQLRNSRSL